MKVLTPILISHSHQSHFFFCCRSGFLCCFHSLLGALYAQESSGHFQCDAVAQFREGGFQLTNLTCSKARSTDDDQFAFLQATQNFH